MCSANRREAAHWRESRSTAELCQVWSGHWTRLPKWMAWVSGCILRGTRPNTDKYRETYMYTSVPNLVVSSQFARFDLFFTLFTFAVRITAFSKNVTWAQISFRGGFQWNILTFLSIHAWVLRVLWYSPILRLPGGFLGHRNPWSRPGMHDAAFCLANVVYHEAVVSLGALLGALRTGPSATISNGWASHSVLALVMNHAACKIVTQRYFRPRQFI
jgi:hypothetical protein